MSVLQFSFYFFSLVLVASAALVVTVKNPVKAALFLVLAFFSAACVWMTLEAEFLAIVYAIPGRLTRAALFYARRQVVV